jgi:hypothetical protein
MKRIILAIFALMAVSVGAEAQSTQETIDRALAAAPNRARDEATVIMWNDDHSYETLQEGSNRMVCYDRSSDEGRPPFASQCTVLGNLERVAQSRKFSAEAADRDGVNAMVAAAEANGTRVPPVFGSPFISMNGRDEASARTHITIAMPGATMANSGFPENGRSGGAWIMDAGTTTAHLMIPGT